jgi:hypothetical protein
VYAALGAGSTRKKSVTGTWTLTVEHFGLKLELAQKNAVATHSTGAGDPIKLTGAFTATR